jgi:hypothetical protein
MPTRSEAVAFLEENAHDMFGDCVSMLYVGHRHDTAPWWRTTFAGLIDSPLIDIVDIVPGNLPHDLVNEGLVRTCFHGDILACDARQYSLVFWDEGPEHVPRDEALRVLARMAEMNTHVLISCPWGHQPQGSGPGDPEFHHWAPQPADFESIGFRTATFGTMFDGVGGGHGNLLAWR